VSEMDGDVPPARPSYSFSASWSFFSQVARAVLSLGNVLVVSRWLGPVGRGDYAFLTTIAYITSETASLSIDYAASQVAGRFPERRRAVGGTVVALAAILGVLSVAILAGLFVAFPAIGPRVGIHLRVLALASIPPMILATYLIRLVYVDFGIRVANIAILMQPLVNVVVNAVLAATGQLTVTSAFCVWIAGQLLGLLLLVWYLHTRLAGFGRPDVGLAREMLSFGLKSYGGRALQLGNYRLDQWFVGALAGSRELGLYSVAVAWSEGLFILPRALAEAQRPYLIRASRDDAGAEAASVVRFSILLTIPAAAIVIVLAPFLCTTIFGSAFHGSIMQLRILALGAFGIAAMKILGTALISQEKPLLEAVAIAIAFIATIVLDLVLIPSHGGLGAAYASTISYTVGGVAVALIAARTLGVPLGRLYPTPADVRTVVRGSAALARRLSRQAAAAPDN
jgi:O-antigen/teichoic acid export membrane protein